MLSQIYALSAISVAAYLSLQPKPSPQFAPIPRNLCEPEHTALVIENRTVQPATANLKTLAEQSARRHGLPVDLFNALIQQESAWRVDEVSSAGAIGLTQVMPSTGKSECGLSPDDLLNPAKNLDCGAMYLAKQRRRFNSDRLALAAYNGGAARVTQLGRIPRIAETQNYVDSICSNAVCGGAL